MMEDDQRQMFIYMIADYIANGNESIAIGDLEYFFPEEVDQAYEKVRMDRLETDPDPMLDPQLG
jgi:hypothetical protein